MGMCGCLILYNGEYDIYCELTCHRFKLLRKWLFNIVLKPHLMEGHAFQLKHLIFIFSIY